jgi:hypothetical protein
MTLLTTSAQHTHAFIHNRAPKKSQALGMTTLKTVELPKQPLSPKKRNPNLVIPTGAKRSGGTCSFAGFAQRLPRNLNG